MVASICVHVYVCLCVDFTHTGKALCPWDVSQAFNKDINLEPSIYLP